MIEVTRKMYEVYYKVVGYEVVKPKRSTKKRVNKMSYKEDVYSLLEVKGVDISNFDLDILNMRIEGIFQSAIEYTNNDFTKMVS